MNHEHALAVLKEIVYLKKLVETEESESHKKVLQKKIKSREYQVIAIVNGYQ